MNISRPSEPHPPLPPQLNTPNSVASSVSPVTFITGIPAAKANLPASVRQPASLVKSPSEPGSFPTKVHPAAINYGVEQTVFAVGTFAAMLRNRFDTVTPVRSFKYATELLEIIDSDVSGCLVVDAQLPDRTGVDLHRQLVSGGYDLSTIIVSQHDASYLARSAFRSGVVDVLSGDLAPGEIAGVLAEALQNNAFRHGKRKLRRVHRLRVDKLTSRELDVAKLLSKGHALKEVGAQLNISVQTASKHRSNIFTKLRVTNEVELHKTLTDCMESVGTKS